MACSGPNRDRLFTKSPWGLRVQTIVLAFLVKTGLNPNEIAKGKANCPVSVPKTTIYRWWKHYNDYGEVQEITRRHAVRSRRKLIPPVHLQVVKGLLTRDPRLYVDEIQEALDRVVGVRYSLKSIANAIKRPPARGGLGYTQRVLEERAAQASEEEQHLYRCCISSVPRPEMLVFIDETHKSRKDARRRRGWGPIGKAIISKLLFNSSDRENYTLIGAVDIGGFIKSACHVVFRKHNSSDMEPTRGSVDGDRFVAYVEEILVPELGRYEHNEPRSVVVLDNASIHKDPRVVELIEEAGARVIWTAPYSPWLNPIEHCFASYKRRLQRLEKLGTIERGSFL